MTKDIVVICAGMLAVSVGVWTLWGNPQSTTPARTEVVRILADDPALKFASERALTCGRNVERVIETLH